MKKEVAYNFFKTGKLPKEPEPTIPEVMQLMLGACRMDNGDIWCCQCHKPNECCECGMGGKL